MILKCQLLLSILCLSKNSFSFEVVSDSDSTEDFTILNQVAPWTVINIIGKSTSSDKNNNNFTAIPVMSAGCGISQLHFQYHAGQLSHSIIESYLDSSLM